MLRDQALTARDVAVMKIDSIFSQAQSYHLSRTTLLEKLYTARNEHTDLPRWVRSYLEGYILARLKGHEVLTEWRLYWRGAYVTRQQIAEGTWDEVEPDKCAWFYIGTDIKFC